MVYLTDGACLKITEQELLDFGLRAGDEVDEEMRRRLRTAAGVSDTRAAAAELMGRRAMSRRDLERKLQERGASRTESRYAAEWMEAIGAINDAEYAAMLVRHCGQQGYGPGRVREKLREKGVPRELWEDALKQLPPPEEQIEAFLNSKLHGEVPDVQQQKKLAAALARRGFGWSDVRAALSRWGAELPDE
ncbi:MAG: regulatory protein RecX [Ruminococcaceae bacterium]|nr:regulatory protein RecX [Oscillospiraceae bacterium]